MKFKRLVIAISAAAFAIAGVATVWANHPLPNGEDFDGVTAPALPTGWTASQPQNVATVAAWVTSATSPDAGTNDAFSIDSTDVLDNILDSVSFTGSSDTAVLSFRNNYNLESGFDGAVLEISISSVSGGAFQDVVAAGGSFTVGGYTPSTTISSNFGSPIAGRSAWTGNSNGYTNTTVTLPTAATTGTTVKLRWRLASDNSYGGTPLGWRVDTISLCGTNAISCLKTDINGSTAGASYKTVLTSTLSSAQTYFNIGNTASGCVTMNSFKTLDTTYSSSPGTTGITVVMATAWNLRADAIRASYTCT